MRTLIPAAIAVFSISMPALCQSVRDIQRELDKLMELGRYEFGCLVNGRSNERLRINAFVYGDFKQSHAIVFNTWVASVATPIPPCLSVFGRCAVYKGELVDFSAICKSSRSDLIGYTEHTLSLREDSGKSELENTGSLLKLARDLQPQDIAVSSGSGDAWWSYGELNSDETLAVRIRDTANSVYIENLRTSLESVDGAKALELAAAYGINQFRLFGVKGAITSGGFLLTEANDCFALVSSSTFRDRVQQAHAVAPIESTGPTNLASWERALGDVLQTLVGGEVVNGEPISYELIQDPTMFVYETGISECDNVH